VSSSSRTSARPYGSGSGITHPGNRIWLRAQWFTVTGILHKALPAPELDTSALVGRDAAERLVGRDAVKRLVGRDAVKRLLGRDAAERLVGRDAAERLLGFDGRPTQIHLRSTDSKVGQVRDVLAATVNPENLSEVTVSRPSDALTAEQAANNAFTGLLVGIGGIALLLSTLGGAGATSALGALAGLWPAVRAARLAPREALSSP
jgi:putative ABC transport system permease protein